MSKSILQIILRVTKEGSGERQAAKEAKELKATLGQLGLGSLASASALGILSGAVIAVGKYMLEGAEKAEKSNQVLAKQNQVLIATNYAAGLTSRQLNQMAAAYSKLAGVDDDVIRDAQTMLLTFRKIGKDVFPQALQATLDLSTTFGGVQQSATQLGKALNDPVAGMTALAKSGVTFSDSQKRQIRTYQELGQVQRAQMIILAEINNQVGGTAEAMEKASNGSVRLKVAYENLQKNLAGGLIDAQREWNYWLAETLENIDKNVSATKNYNIAQDKAIQHLTNGQKIWGSQVNFIKNNYAAVEQLTRVIQKGIDTTDYYNDLLAQQGKYFDETTGTVVSYTETLVISEEALQELSKTNQEFYKGLQSFQDMEERFSQRNREIAAERVKIEAEKAAYIAQYGNWNIAKIQEFDDALEANGKKAAETADEHEKATKKVILGYMEQKMMADGILDDKEIEWLLKKGTEWGIYSEKVIQGYRDAQTEADAYIAKLNGIPSSTHTTAYFDISVDSSTPGYAYFKAYAGYEKGTDGWETVPAGYPDDSYPVFLTSGEKFAVIPAGAAVNSFDGAGGMMTSRAQGGGTEGLAVEIRLRDEAERLFAPMVERIMARRR